MGEDFIKVAYWINLKLSKEKKGTVTRRKDSYWILDTGLIHSNIDAKAIRFMALAGFKSVKQGQKIKYSFHTILFIAELWWKYTPGCTL